MLQPGKSTQRSSGKLNEKKKKKKNGTNFIISIFLREEQRTKRKKEKKKIYVCILRNTVEKANFFRKHFQKKKKILDHSASII